MRVLLGTTNPSKVKRYEQLLSGCGIEFLTLSDLGITDEPEEIGSTPAENAAVKARFYGRYFDRVLCNDGGLYLEALPMDDPRQPGLHIRTPMGRQRLDDEQMIAYYSELVRSLGGRTKAYYLDGSAVYSGGEVFTIAQTKETATAFYLIDRPSGRRHPGWPLDSISLNMDTMKYFTDDLPRQNSENIIIGQYSRELMSFLKKSLGIKE